MKPFLSILFLITLSVACGGDELIEKGDEEQALTDDGKSDSFFKPTEHGALTFGVPSRTSVGTDRVFHSWNFTLSDDAEVVLNTDVSKNLDTVMYLYRRDNPEDSWGRFIKKNDDHEGNIWSQITLKGEAAEYRVIVKPFKKALRGDFSITAKCEGAGCATTNPQPNQCVTGTFPSAPGEGFTDVCASKIMKLVRTPLVSSSNGFIDFEKHCELSGAQQLAVLHYSDYFEQFGFGSLEEVFDFGDGISYEFTHNIYQGGHEIDINAGGDEDSASLFYDNDLNLLALYQHNQSPDVQFSCGEVGDTTKDREPFAECMSPILFETPKSNDVAKNTFSGTDTLEEIEGMDILGATDLGNDFFTTHEQVLEEDTEIDFEYAEYESFNNKVGVLTLSIKGSNDPITYTAYSDSNGVMYVRTRDGKDSISCEK